MSVSSTGKLVGNLLAMCIACTGGFEGLRTTAYHDPAPAHTLTACYGETSNIKEGERFTKQACDDMLSAELQRVDDGVQKCVHVALPDSRRVAVDDLAYNIGVGAFCKSSIPRKLNAGQVQAACQTFLKYDTAGGQTLPGLVKRRKAEYDLCMK